MQKRTYQLDVLRRQGKPRLREETPESNGHPGLPPDANRLRNAPLTEGAPRPVRVEGEQAKETGEKEQDEGQIKDEKKESPVVAEEMKEEAASPSPPPSLDATPVPPAVADSSSHEKHASGSKKSEFHSLDPKEVAEELTMIDNQLFRKIDRRELLKKNFMKQEEAVSFNRMVARFNLVSYS